MATIAMPMPVQRRSFPWLWILAALIISAVFVSVAHEVTARSHAAKHGQALAEQTRMCLDKNGAATIWVSDERGMFAQCADLDGYPDWMDPGKQWGIQIIDQKTGEEITIFLHEGDFRSLEEYLTRALYQILR